VEALSGGGRSYPVLGVCDIAIFVQAVVTTTIRLQVDRATTIRYAYRAYVTTHDRDAARQA